MKRPKVTAEIIAKIREMRKNTVQRKVANALNLSEVTVRKYESDENLERSFRSAKDNYSSMRCDKERNERHKAYMRNYMNNRYRNDPEFRQRMLNCIRRYQMRQKEKKKEAQNAVVSWV